METLSWFLSACSAKTGGDWTFPIYLDESVRQAAAKRFSESADLTVIHAEYWPRGTEQSADAIARGFRKLADRLTKPTQRSLTGPGWPSANMYRLEKLKYGLQNVLTRMQNTIPEDSPSRCTDAQDNVDRAREATQTTPRSAGQREAGAGRNSAVENDSEVQAAAPSSAIRSEQGLAEAGATGRDYRSAPDDAPVDTQVLLDEERFTVSAGGRTCRLGNSQQFRLMKALVERKGKFTSFALLAKAIGRHEDDSIAHIKSRLCKQLNESELTGLADNIRTEDEHYGLYPG